MHSKIRSLLFGMIYFLLALLLTIALFWGLWVFSLDPAESSDHASAPSAAAPTGEKKERSDRKQKSSLSQQTEASASSSDAAPAPVPVLQGPKAGSDVLPPDRNVTPGFEASPLAQTDILTREDGNPLPPPSERPALPSFFRKVQVISATELEASLRSDRLTIHLAHIKGPNETQMCVLFGQRAPCHRLAKSALQRFLRGRGISCDLSLEQEKAYRARQKGSSSVASTCWIGRSSQKSQGRSLDLPDLARWLVLYGWAVPINGHYMDAHKIAQAQKRGLYTEDKSALPGPLAPRQLSQEKRNMLDLLAAEAVGGSHHTEPIADLIDTDSLPPPLSNEDSSPSPD